MDGDSEFEADLRRSQRNRRIVLIGLGLVAAAGLIYLLSGARSRGRDSGLAPQVKLTDAELKELAATAEQSKQKLMALDAPWRPAIEAVIPRAVQSEQPCKALDWARRGLAGNPQSSDWGSWSVKIPLDFNASSIGSFSHAPFPLLFFKAEEALPPHSPELTARVADLDAIAKGYTYGASTLATRKKYATIEQLAATDVLVRIDRLVEPRLEGRDRFMPGMLEVSAWAFDHKTNKVVCAGVVRATSSVSVDPRSSNLNDDLTINLVRALPDNLHSLP